MRLKVLWVGKTQEEWVRRGIDEYAGRIGRYMPLISPKPGMRRGQLPRQCASVRGSGF